MDKVTGKSKGYGFVVFEDQAVAEKVKKASNLYFLGKMMNVGDAMRKSDGQGNPPRGGNMGMMQGQQYPYAMGPIQQPIYANGQAYYPQQYYPQIPAVNYSQSGFQQAWQPIPPPNSQGSTSPTQQQQQQGPPMQQGQPGQPNAPPQANLQALQQQLQQLQQLQQFYQMQQQYLPQQMGYQQGFPQGQQQQQQPSQQQQQVPQYQPPSQGIPQGSVAYNQKK